MQRSVLEYLEYTAAAYPDKAAFVGEDGTFTFSEIRRAARAVGSVLLRQIPRVARRAVIVFQKRRPETIAAMLGAAYSGAFYVTLDPELPLERLQAILDRVDPVAVISVEGDLPEVRTAAPVLNYAEVQRQPVDDALLEAAAQSMTDQDPLYVLFTSGSTGAPKGVITSHRAVIDYIDAFARASNMTSEDVLGSQAPLDYVAALRDIYLPLKLGARCVLLPKKLFSLPGRLFDALEEYRVTTLCWVVSALCIPARMNAFDRRTLSTVNKVIFTGAVMPCKYLRRWQIALPNATFINHYGPTEITASCTFAVIEHLVEEDERLPIGRPYPNTRIVLLDDEDKEVARPGEIGEICVLGCCLALGYYGDPELTRTSFVNDPRNTAWPERMYRTGDYAHRDGEGVLWFHGRRDSQIKLMGHRVEMGEIELAARALKGVEDACCFFQEEQERLWLFVEGQAEAAQVFEGLKARLPAFMVPKRVSCLPAFPLLPNGKTDRAALGARMEVSRRGTH